jgi:hypothetical protein
MNRDKIHLRYSPPDSLTNEVIVSRVLPDNSSEPIGKIYPDPNNGEDSLIYVSVNNKGEEIIPPSADFISIEKQFEQYAKELSEKSLHEDFQKESESREESLANIRYLKNVNRELSHFNKLFTKTFNL